ncbi:MAG TPA: c-type cytochrome, partial [Candidatus Sulfotelmatobacter sp.]|nr:c-type cytochrome [Candidatus Sulfotelmatobacter sp.]
MKIRKRVLASLGTFIVIGAVVGTLKAHSNHVPQHSGPDIGSPVQTPKKAEEQFKNIRILKGIPADQLFPTMEFMSASLGVNCEFCHVKNAFEKDDKKPKQTARKMMEMMFTINRENFDGRRNVTCYSCHRGDAKPLAIPVVMAEKPKTTGELHGAVAGGTEKGSSASSPSAEQLLDKYVQALGG